MGQTLDHQQGRTGERTGTKTEGLPFIKHITITNNGTLPLQIAIKALGLSGEIITTPFSYVASTASIVGKIVNLFLWISIREYLTIDETKIEEAITSKTTAILATHVFGNPCNLEAIEAIAKKHHLKVIYDAAHCFGVKYKGQSIFNYGDVSACSFHATKLFHTGEGGAMFCNDAELHQRLYYHHNFGTVDRWHFWDWGSMQKFQNCRPQWGWLFFRI